MFTHFCAHIEINIIHLVHLASAECHEEHAYFIVYINYMHGDVWGVQKMLWAKG